MTPEVFILATCRKPDLLPYTQLVFKTLRVGFPTARVKVFLNSLGEDASRSIAECCARNQCEHMACQTIHHCWIEQLVKEQTQPFYLLDTDVVFYGNFEEFVFNGPIAGWRIPEWNDEFSGCLTRARLHTSLLYVDPEQVRDGIAKAGAKVFSSEFTPLANLFNPLCLPYKGRMYFYDTCSLLYHAIGGQSFEPRHKDRYFHFNFGTISDLVLPRLQEGLEMDGIRRSVLNNPSSGIGCWRQQEAYYERHRY